MVPMVPMVPLPAALAAWAGAGQGRAPLLAWRIDAEPYAASWHSGIGAELFGGRWNPKGQRAVYCSLDPATCLVEAAVHRGFEVLDSRPHVLSCVLIDLPPHGPASPVGGSRSAGGAGGAAPAGIRVLHPDELPNPAWLNGGTPSAGQQRFGAELLAAHGVLVLPSAVSKCSWNLVFSPSAAAGRFSLQQQQRLVVDTRLNPPRA